MDVVVERRCVAVAKGEVYLTGTGNRESVSCEQRGNEGRGKQRQEEGDGRAILRAPDWLARVLAGCGCWRRVTGHAKK